MARGRIITPEVEALIRRVHLNNPKMKANEVRNLVKSELRTKENYSALWPIPKEWPSLSKVQKVLAKVIREEKELSEEEKKQEEPWDMSTLGEYPIPPEAVPLVLDVSMQLQQPLTIREAKWIGRLYRLIAMVVAQQGIDKVSIDYVAGIAMFYATTERLNALKSQRVPPTMDKILWEFLTKRKTLKSTSEAFKREFRPGMKDDRFRMDEDGRLYYRVTKAERAELEKEHRALYSTPFDDFSVLGLTLEIKEAEHERQHKTKRQK